MNPLLTQFLAEARDFLQGIGEKLMQLEQAPNDADLMIELFRLVHTLKGNSGLFDFPEMTRVLHAGEDLMDAVRNGRIDYSQELADQLLDAMDFVGILCDEIESTGRIDAARAADSAMLAVALRALHALADAAADSQLAADAPSPATPAPDQLPLAAIPELVRLDAYQRAMNGDAVHWITYHPLEECFFQGDDPFFTARQTPDILWGRIVAREPWLPLAELDAYRSVLEFQLLTSAPRGELAEHYRYVPDQVGIVAVDARFVVIPQGNPNGGPVYDDFVADALQHLEAGDLAALKQAALTMLHLSNPDLWLSSALRWLLQLIGSVPDDHAALRSLIESLLTLTAPDWAAANPALAASAAAPKEARASAPPISMIPRKPLSEEDAIALEAIFAAQRQVLLLDDHPAWQPGRLKAAGAVLVNCCKATGDQLAQHEIETALQLALATDNSAPLLAWLVGRADGQAPAAAAASSTGDALVANSATPLASVAPVEPLSASRLAIADEGPRFTRRAEDVNAGPTSLKVDQSKIDLLMNLIGEMVVSKNALPYLAQRAEEQFGVRELAREIKAQYAVINRIAEEMQNAIMQVRMMPVSFVFQRFPRLVRDISRKLGKEVQLVLEGEDTEADKNIIESLADPLIHIVRNSLDHGLETPDLRLASGKPALGTLTIRAIQQGDQVLIEIIDDGKGIDPAVIKRKAYEKGVIDEATLERISDRDALNLVFASGFSTVEVVSDLSGRGVGMDVVRTAVEKVNGTIVLESEVAKGTRICISLPLSMAVTQAMIVESDRQIFGVPMDHVVETVRIPCSAIRTIKRSQTIVLRGKIIPLKALNALLGLPAAPQANAYDEMAVLVARVGGESIGLIVDDFRETVDVIQKPLTGVLAGLSAYSGSALMGDGSVLMMLNVKEII
ncbi:chemotaxis protein CheA [Janthinobacterium sp. CG3]|uniref:chemotaxis protein CheA n=1 Tax=Janthinobacterium sp. CG3 TaxID=1075768 RepID=UPI00034A61E0|nr:chemotaxis protein CheA [Janthinobacterium sp. CG3]